MFESVCNQIYCNEGEKVQLKCTVCSEVIYVEWLFENEMKIFQNENTIIESEGKHHCLTFQKANLSNDGEYIMVAGNIQKRIHVTVKGKEIISYYHTISALTARFTTDKISTQLMICNGLIHVVNIFYHFSVQVKMGNVDKVLQEKSKTKY